MFDARGYGEVHTPALEYEQVLTRGDPAAADPAYRLFDEQGNVLVLRSDMTIPIARVVSTRYASARAAAALLLRRPRLPLRAPAARAGPRDAAGRDRARRRARRPQGTAEALTVLCEALDAVGLADYRVGLGDASLYPALLDAHGVPAAARARDPARARDARLRRARARGRGAAAGRRGDGGAARACRSGAAAPRCSTRPGPAARRAARASTTRCRRRVAERVIFDLGLARALGYYTGAVFEVYDAGARRAAGRRRPLRRPARPLRPRPAGGRLGAQRRAAAHRAGRRAPRGAAL